MNTMMIRRLFCLALALCLCATCSSAPRWKQEGKTQEQTERDYKECEKLTRDRYGSIANQDSPHFQADLNSCMESRGYKRDD
jgi:hypothetical protein